MSRPCRRGLHEIPAGKKECPTCKRARDREHDRNYKLAGKRAEADRERYRLLYHTDPEFREAEKARCRRYYRERRARARNLGISMAAYRDMTE